MAALWIYRVMLMISSQPRQESYCWTYLLNDTGAGGNLALGPLRSNLDDFRDRTLTKHRQ